MKTCFLCQQKLKDVKIFDFNKHTLQKCKLMSKFRKIKNFKYMDVIVNDDTIEAYGYHQICYKKFICLSQKYRDEYEDYFDIKEETANDRGIQIPTKSQENITQKQSNDGHKIEHSWFQDPGQNEKPYNDGQKIVLPKQVDPLGILNERHPESIDQSSKRRRLDQDSTIQDKRPSQKSEKEDEFDIFGRHVAMQLKYLPEEYLVVAQEEIQSVLTRYRLKSISGSVGGNDSVSSNPINPNDEIKSEILETSSV